MRVLVRRTDTLEYYAGPGFWVKDRNSAFDFQSTMQALDFCLQSRLKGADIVMAWSNSALDLVFPWEPQPDTLLAEAETHALQEDRA